MGASGTCVHSMFTDQAVRLLYSAMATNRQLYVRTLNIRYDAYIYYYLWLIYQSWCIPGASLTQATDTIFNMYLVVYCIYILFSVCRFSGFTSCGDKTNNFTNISRNIEYQSPPASQGLMKGIVSHTLFFIHHIWLSRIKRIKSTFRIHFFFLLFQSNLTWKKKNAAPSKWWVVRAVQISWDTGDHESAPVPWNERSYWGLSKYEKAQKKTKKTFLRLETQGVCRFLWIFRNNHTSTALRKTCTLVGNCEQIILREP